MSKTIFDKLRSRKGLLSPTALAEIINFKVSTLQMRIAGEALNGAISKRRKT